MVQETEEGSIPTHFYAVSTMNYIYCIRCQAEFYMDPELKELEPYLRIKDEKDFLSTNMLRRPRKERK